MTGVTGREEWISALLARMTLAEKAAQLSSIWLSFDPETGAVAPSQMSFGGEGAFSPEEALAHGIGQITRPLGSAPVDPVAGARAVNELQRRLVEGTRLGIPAICHEECLSGAMFAGATSFPAPVNLASTWDPSLAEAMTAVIRRQLRAVGATQGLAPVADVARDARWGRVEETMGEDPYLGGTMVTAYVRGLQGDDLSRGVVATLKHFCGYSFSEGGRNFAPAHLGWRELRDVLALPFEMAVRHGGALSVMSSYQEIDGEPTSSSPDLLTGLLRDRWGFDGFTVADYGAVRFLQVLHHVAADSAEAVALALRAGLDVELPNPLDYPKGIPQALDRGLLSMAEVDRAVARVLAVKVRLGLFENPYVDPDAVPAALRQPEDAALASEIARRSIVVLHNDGTLPLAPAAGGDADGRGGGEGWTVAVLGPNADDPLALFGNYSFENHLLSTHFADAPSAPAVEAPSVLRELEHRLGPERVSHHQGCEVRGGDTSGIAEAAALAAGASTVVLVVGDRAGHFNLGTVGEGSDASSLQLPGVQPQLVRAVLATGTPTVVVLLCGRPYSLVDLVDPAADAPERQSGTHPPAAAVMAAWFPGEGGAGAIADVLLGIAEPEGRSPFTFSRAAGAQPRFYNHKQLAPGFPRQADFDAVFPFGHGLTYTTFDYADLRLRPREVPTDGSFSVSCTVSNAGTRQGTEVVQLYLHDRVASVTRPVAELKGFARVPLEPGQTARVRFDVPVDLLSFTGLDGRLRVEPGSVSVLVGASSADVRLRGQVEVTGSVRTVGDDRALTSTAMIELEDAR